MARVVSVVSAKAEVEGRKVALGTALEAPLADLQAELLREEGGARPAGVRVLRGGGATRFVRPTE